jgi:HEAT repeat protein
MTRRRRILLAILAAMAVLAAAGAWLLREEFYLERLPPEVRARMPGHWRIPSGLAPEVREGIEGLYAAEPAARREAAHALGNLGPDAAPAVPFLMATLAAMPDQYPSTHSLIFTPPPSPSWLQRAWDRIRSSFTPASSDSLGEQTRLEAGDEAAFALVEIGQPAIEPLLAALSDPLPRVRARAAVALGMIGDARAAAPLVGLFVEASRWKDVKHEEEADREHLKESAARAVKELGEPAQKPLLAELIRPRHRPDLADLRARREPELTRRPPPPDGRPALIELLGYVGDERAVPRLEALVAEQDSIDYPVQQAASGALELLALPPARRVVERAEEVHSLSLPLDPRLAAIPSPNDEAALSELIQWLGTDDLAAEVLGKSGSERAAATLAARLSGSRCAAEMVALFSLGDRAVDALEAFAGAEDNWSGYETAVAVLGDIGTPRAVDALLRLEARFPTGKRIAVLRALGNSRNPRAYQPLADALLNDEDSNIRFTAAVALGVSGDPRACDLLAPLLDSEKWEVSSAAAEGLRYLGDRRAVPGLLGLAKKQAARNQAAGRKLREGEDISFLTPLKLAAAGLIRFQEPQGIVFLAQGEALSVDAWETDLRVVLAEQIAAMGPAAIGPLVEACGLVRSSANVDFTRFSSPVIPFCALAAIDDPRAAEAFWRFFPTMPLAGRQQILETLVEMRSLRGKQGVEVLRRIATTDADRLLRRIAVGYLAVRGTPEAMAVIREVAAKDRCRTVRRWAAWVLAGGITPGPMGEGFDAAYAPIWKP